MSSAPLALFLALGLPPALPAPESQGQDPSREAAVEHLLSGARDLTSEEVRLAYEAGVEAATELRLEDAIAIQSALHQAYRATWSAANLAMTLGTAGEFELADELLAEQIARDPSQAAPLWNQRGHLAQGRGADAEARAHFGRALAGGSSNAAMTLARMDLEEGRLSEARRGFRALLTEEPPHAWTLRGWGQSLLEAAPRPDPSPASAGPANARPARASMESD